jgi:hypothetical protein
MGELLTPYRQLGPILDLVIGTPRSNHTIFWPCNLSGLCHYNE